MVTQKEKAERFKALHDNPGCFVIANPWDAGSTKILDSLGFKALATTSAGLAFSLGRSDCRARVSKQQAFANVRDIVSATDLPVSGDLENGYHDDPEGVFATITEAASLGLVGASIEDTTGREDDPIYPFEMAVERIRAAAAAVKQMEIPFLLTARAENFLHGRPDLADTIKRLQAFQDAGADVLFAPGLKSKEDIQTVVNETDRPVNVIMGLSGVNLSVQELTELGVSRISLGSSLYRAAQGALFSASREVLDEGKFSFAESATPYAQLNRLFEASRAGVEEILR